MKKITLFKHDLKILTKVFFGKEKFDLNCREEQNEVLVINDKASSKEFDQIKTNSKHKHILSFKPLKIEGFDQSLKFDYIKNTDGTLRWMYQKNDLNSVLLFYPTLTMRSKLIGSFFKVISFLKLGKLLKNGSIYLYSKESFVFQETLGAIDHDHFGFFAGTKGNEQTPVLSIIKKNKATHFLKIAINDYTLNTINVERRNLTKLNFLELKTAQFPSELFTRNYQYLITENIADKASSRSVKFSKSHMNLIIELYERKTNFQKLEHYNFWDEILNNIYILKNSNLNKESRLLLKVLLNLKSNVSYDEEVLTSISLGDFTPWNIYLKNDKIYAYDFENVLSQGPFLYDLFHFHFQGGHYLENKSSQQILKDIFETCQNYELRKIVRHHNIDILKYLKLYLLHRVSMQMVLLRDSKEENTKRMKQFEVWKDALITLDGMSFEQVKNDFIHDLNQILASKAHAFIKFEVGQLENLANYSDLDIALNRKDIKEVLHFVRNNSFVSKMKVTRKSFMTNVYCTLINGEVISLDFIYQLKVKSKLIMNFKDLLKDSKFNSFGIRVPAIKHDLEYVLGFYFLNNAFVPTKYIDLLSQADDQQKAEALNYINQKYKIDIKNWDDLFIRKSKFKLAFNKRMKQKSLFNPIGFLNHQLNYTLDTLKQAVYYRSLTITISGVDGVGKTTVIQSILNNLPKLMRREVVLLRHRPKFLPILSTLKYGNKAKAESLATEQAPSDAKNIGRISSYLRFAYYLTDYLFGQIVIFFKYKIKGKVVVYDRYYYDFINHPERSNLMIPKRVSKWFYKFIAKPDVNILLYAEPEVIYQRKKELDPNTIERLTKGYSELFTEFDQKYKTSHFRIVENKTIKDTTENILNIIQKVA